MKILVTGGLGYIGSHTVVELCKNGYEVVIVDNLVNSDINVLEKLQQITGRQILYHNIDVTDKIQLETVFSMYNFDSVIHFAGLKAVGESIEKPLIYYKNNLLGTINIAELGIKYNVNHIVFSSSATVYGNQTSPLFEYSELKPTTNPYGETKAMSERILMDIAKANPKISVTILRYFNPIGAHQSGLIGENPNGIPNNLLPFITKVAKGTLKELSVYGNDYDTLDGTGVRDYIHVVDLAKGHVAALDKVISNINIYNLGTGSGTSVFQIIEAFKKYNNIDVPFKIVCRRAGDIDSVFADCSKAERDLAWKATLKLKDMVVDAWRFEKMN